MIGQTIFALSHRRKVGRRHGCGGDIRELELTHAGRAQLFATIFGVMASLQSGAIPRCERCFMRLFGLVAAPAVFLLPLTVFAQHSAAPASVPSIPIASHTLSAISPVTHSPVIAHSPGTTSGTGTQGPRAVALRSSSKLNGSHADDRSLLKPSTNSRPQKAGFFSFIHRRPNKCRHGSCAASPSSSLITQSYAFPRMDSEVRVGCRVVPIANPAIPCNMFSPCCP